MSWASLIARIPWRAFRALSSPRPPRARPLSSVCEPGVSPGRPVCRSSLRSATVLLSQRRLVSFHDGPTTIYALSSAPGKAGIAVIRVSGEACLNIYKSLCPSAPALRPRYAAVRTLHDPEPVGTDAAANVLDTHAVVLYFPGPKTVTGEDVLELHVHGGPATVRAVLAAIPRAKTTASIRYAEPGEFTRRAFLHDRLDLAQVEALGDTLDAETEQQRRAAVRGSSGQLGRTYEGWRAQLLAARAELEALIDFSEDQHFDEPPRGLLASAAGQVRGLLAALAAHEAAGARGSLLRQGIRLALVGPANAGKSSLMNLVVGREASIVSQEAGTTRDVVEASLDIRGFLCTFADTAGFRDRETETETNGVGAIETEGLRRARQAAESADVVVVLASVEPVSSPSSNRRFRVRYDAETLRLAAQARHHLAVLNKCDLAPDPRTLAALEDDFRAAVQAAGAQAGAQADRSTRQDTLLPPTMAVVSCREAEAAAAGVAAAPLRASSADTRVFLPVGDGLRGHRDVSSDDPGGIRRLVDALGATFAAMTGLPPDAQHLLGVTARQQQLLAACRTHLQDFLDEAETPPPADPDLVLAAEHLRWAAACLGRITGRGEAGDVEEVLGVIFEKFCVGK